MQRSHLGVHSRRNVGATRAVPVDVLVDAGHVDPMPDGEGLAPVIAVPVPAIGPGHGDALPEGEGLALVLAPESEPRHEDVTDDLEAMREAWDEGEDAGYGDNYYWTNLTIIDDKIRRIT